MNHLVPYKYYNNTKKSIELLKSQQFYDVSISFYFDYRKVYYIKQNKNERKKIKNKRIEWIELDLVGVWIFKCDS